MVPNSNSPTPSTLLTPANYANKYLSFDSNGNPTPALLTSSGSLTAAIIYSLTGIVGPQTATEALAGAAVVNQNFAVGVVDRYGTNTIPGTTSMVSAITAAIAVAKQQGGGTVTFLDGIDYFVGNFSTGFQPQGVFNITSASNITFKGRARIVSSTTSAALPYIFYCKDCSNITWDGLRFFDSGFVILGEQLIAPIKDQPLLLLPHLLAPIAEGTHCAMWNAKT